MHHVTAIPAFADNYLWLLDDGQEAVVVDPGDAGAVEAVLQSKGLRLSAILITHHHADHIGGVEALVGRYQPQVYAPVDERIPYANHRVSQDSEFSLLSGSLHVKVMETPGHTRSHIVYYLPQARQLYCGDTLFGAGCGRLFEGSAEQMWDSLQKLKQLPLDTEVFCAHEYTAANLRFALAADPDNAALQARAADTAARRARHESTVPFRLDLELQTNPFLRSGEPELRLSAERQSKHALTTAAAVFKALRLWKDGYS